MLVPKLRFKREDGTDYPEWTKQKLSAVASRVTRKNKGNITDIPLTIASLYGLVDQREYFKKKIASQNMEGYYLLHNGEFAYNKSHSKGFDFGAIKRLDRYDCGALSTLYICFAVNNKVDSDFMTHYFDSQKWNKEVSIRCAEGARNHGLLNISTNDFFDIDMVLPADLEEQQKIADFLSNVDEVIAQSEAEVANLQQQKKAAMQKIFSQEVRFKREDGTSYPEWNSKSFSDNFSSLNNNTFSRNMLSESGSVCNIHYGDIFVKYGEICDVQKENIPKVNDHIDTGKYDLLQDGDIILADTAEDETVGKATEILNVDTATVISGLHTMACRPNYKFAPMYLGYYINSPTYHNQLLPFMQGIKVTSIGRKNISETSISFPCLEEQQKIADFLATYDEAISCAKQELDKWKELKKGLLQQMFA